MKFIKLIKKSVSKVSKIKALKQRFTKKETTADDKLVKRMIFNSSETPKVSIIIPFYNQELYTLNCLYFLNKHLQYTIPFEILLIDDNSSEDYNFSLIQGVTIHRNIENLGFLKSINKGVKLAKGEFIYILNNDTEVRENFLSELFYVFENFKNVGAVGSKILNPDNSLQEAGSLFMRDCEIRQIVKKKESYYPEINYICKVDYCSGCSLLFKKYDEQNNLNLFDEQFAPAYFEETDFCFNLKFNKQKEIYYTPFSQVVHYNGVSYNSLEKSDNAKLLKKEILFKTNLEKFKQKWSIQIKNIQAPTLADRIQEIYGHKSVVIFCGSIPEHDKDSGSNRLKEIITAFVSCDYYVTLISKFTYIENPYIQIYQRLGVNVFYEHQYLKSVSSYLKEQKLDPGITWFYGPKVFIDNYKMAKKKFLNSKLVYDMVDIHHLRYKRAIELDPKRIALRTKYLKYKKLEIKASKHADKVVAISHFEENYMKQICDENKIITISNVHYPKIDIRKTLTFEDRKDVLFIGSSHSPNIDALYYLYNEIMPLVWNKIPNLKVNIIGNLNEVIKDINHPNFVFLGYVPNIDFQFSSNKFMIAPLRFGAGVKGKIGQAFEYYLPVVTSSIGAEGMRLTNNENVLIEDTKDGFADAIINLYTDKKLWQKLQNNSEKSLEPFSREKLKEIIIKMY